MGQPLFKIQFLLTCLYIAKQLGYENKEIIINLRVSGEILRMTSFKQNVEQSIKRIIGLEITAGQRTMSELIWELTGQPFVLPVMLTGHI